MNTLMMKIIWLFAIKHVKTKLSKETNFFRKGFTLAEVLMTLTILGIIAAVSMVVLLPKIQDAENKTAFVSTYSVIDQATSQIRADNGGSLKSVFTSNNILRDKFKEYLNTVKSCTQGQSLGNCWHNNDGSSKYLNGNPITSYNTASSGIVLNNGVLVYLTNSNPNCTSTTYCGLISVDVNGWKGPNTMGKDIYYIWIYENNIKPNDSNNCNTSSSGNGCAAKVLMGQNY
ncbi:MAG: type II secretion system protein [bacterium]